MVFASIPQEFREIPYLKKFKCKKQDRVFPPDAATVNSAPPPSASAPLSEAVSAPRGKCLPERGLVELRMVFRLPFPARQQSELFSATLNSPTVLPSSRQNFPGKKVSHLLHLASTGRPWYAGLFGIMAWGSVVYSEIILSVSWLWGNDVYAVNQKCKGWCCKLCLGGDLLQNATSLGFLGTV